MLAKHSNDTFVNCSQLGRREGENVHQSEEKRGNQIREKKERQKKREEKKRGEKRKRNRKREREREERREEKMGRRTSAQALAGTLARSLPIRDEFVAKGVIRLPLVRKRKSSFSSEVEDWPRYPWRRRAL